MAIIFTKPKNKQFYSLVLLAALLIILLGAVFYFINKNPSIISIEPAVIEPPQINFSYLENPVLALLKPFEFLAEIPETIGRDNPFIYFSTSTTPSTP